MFFGICGLLGGEWARGVFFATFCAFNAAHIIPTRK